MIYLGKNAVGLTIERGTFDTPIILPEEYERLSYIEATGTQYIDTGKYLKLSSEIELEGCHTDSSNLLVNYPRLVGTANPTLYIACVLKGNYNNSLVSSTNYYRFGNGSEFTIAVIPGLKLTHKINKDQYTISMNNYNVTKNMNVTGVTENAQSTLTLFGANNSGTYTNISPGKIYKYKYSENNVLLQYMIPVRYKTNNEVGMYDIINNIFYTNNGTGDFIAGEIIL